MREHGVAAVDRLLEYLPEEIVARLSFAVAGGLVILRARTGRHPAPDLRPKAPMVIGAPRQPPFARSRAGRPSTKTLFEIHTGCCRVRRKRKRLTSNGSIESDAAISRYPDPRRISPRHFR